MYKDKKYLKRRFIEERKPVKFIAQECNVSVSTIENYLKKYNLKRGNIKHTINNDAVDFTSPVFNYLIGLIATDGYMDKKVPRVSLRCKNLGCDKVFNNLKDYFGFTGEIKLYRECYDLSITSRYLIKALKVAGVSPLGKVHNKFPDSFYDEDCARMYFRGLLDGDGNIKPTKIFRITITNKDFLLSMSDYLNKTIGTNTVVKPDRKYWKIEMVKRDSKLFLDWVYKGYEQFRFLDKYYRYIGWRYSLSLQDDKL